MIAIPTINNEAKLYIQHKVQQIAQAHDIQILLAVESGSRAWGFPSVNSDYDVRFIYVHKIEHYLAIDHKRDVIETEIEYSDYLKTDFDMNGWDLKKVLQLALKGNAVVNEWLTSPMSTRKKMQYMISYLGLSSKLGIYQHIYIFTKIICHYPYKLS